MPIYEYECPRCRAQMSVYARTIQPRGALRCPHCPRSILARRLSLFAAPRHAAGGDAASEEGGGGGPDEARLEKMMERLAGEAEKIGEDNPREAARLLRRMSAEAGLPLGAGMEEALSRLAAGEDPDQVEAELGDALESEPAGAETGAAESSRPARRKLPFRDPTLYDWADLEIRTDES